MMMTIHDPKADAEMNAKATEFAKLAEQASKLATAADEDDRDSRVLHTRAAWFHKRAGNMFDLAGDIALGTPHHDAAAEHEEMANR